MLSRWQFYFVRDVIILSLFEIIVPRVEEELTRIKAVRNFRNEIEESRKRSTGSIPEGGRCSIGVNDRNRVTEILHISLRPRIGICVPRVTASTSNKAIFNHPRLASLDSNEYLRRINTCRWI